MSWWKACWSACERCFGVDYLSRPPCGGNEIGESWLGSYVPKILLSVMVKVVVIELTVVDDGRWEQRERSDASNLGQARRSHGLTCCLQGMNYDGRRR
jgi:hypothetical protein